MDVHRDGDPSLAGHEIPWRDLSRPRSGHGCADGKDAVAFWNGQYGVDAAAVERGHADIERMVVRRVQMRRGRLLHSERHLPLQPFAFAFPIGFKIVRTGRERLDVVNAENHAVQSFSHSLRLQMDAQGARRGPRQFHLERRFR